jgi:hypothetical protein
MMRLRNYWISIDTRQDLDKLKEKVWGKKREQEQREKVNG